MRKSVLMGCMGDLVLLKKHRLSPTASLVLGRHSADLANLGTTADSSSVPKQAQRSFFRKQATAVQGGSTKAGFFRIPRILEKDNQGGFEKSTENQKQPQSKKVDSSNNANILSKSQVSLEKPTPNTQKTPKAKLAQDSRIFAQNSQTLKTPQAAGFCDDFWGFGAKGEESYLSGNDRALSEQSPKSAQKPTPKPRKALYIDKEAISSLALVQEGLLSPIASLANSKTLDLSKDSYLTPFVLNPAGKRNRKVLESTKPNEVLDIVFEQRSVGYLRVEEVFPIDRHARTIQLTGLQGGAEFDRIYSRLGDYAVCGEYQVDFPDIKEAKASLQEQIATHNAKHITGLVLDGQVFHNAHEAFIRDALSTSDLVVLFLLKPYRDTLIHYDMQKQCVEFAMRHFLVSDRMCIIPLDDTYLFMGTNNVLLHAMVARNYGCTHFIVSDNTPNLSVFYERNTLYSVLDMVSGISTSIKGGYVYCNTCQMLINRTTCPHGKHHHISYNTESILEFFKVGLLPPSVLVRPSIAAKLLAHLFPNRFSNLQKLYYDLMPFDEGVLLPKSEEDFYLELMRLYELRSK
ncbi:hypothetical protein NYG90_08070 [Helicobacter sp. XJK30-2]|uniref:Uncharacterized protein n=1 Tax=Helicobacter zhangjianzhongii TaxID=2974574 RepID=A0ACC6FTP0_9HELI|nr:hypothetical protein [Helicobacter sp. XJK30-2]MDL0082620.1 hypothetical protein [Helicobacter sp. XJK30-2]